MAGKVPRKMLLLVLALTLAVVALGATGSLDSDEAAAGYSSTLSGSTDGADGSRNRH